jgi:hypothetical protein
VFPLGRCKGKSSSSPKAIFVIVVLSSKHKKLSLVARRTCYAAEVNLRALTVLLPLSLVLFAGCHSSATSSSVAAANDQRAERESQREQIDLIPPPSKTRFMAVHTFDAWENPTITVNPNMLTIHILQADTNPSAAGAGGILRPIGARREDITVSPDKLAEAMAAIPQSAWPYGRVVAIEEAHKTPPSAEPAVRRTLETTAATLNDLGLSAYDLTDGRMQ